MHYRRPEDGVTLIESLVTVAIVGIAFAVFIGGMFTSGIGSDYHRKQATAETLLRQFAESVKAVAYTDCADPVSQPAIYASALPSLSGYTASFVVVQYWNNSTNLFQANCPSNPDHGLQKLTLKVATTDNRDAELVDVVKRGHEKP